MRSSPLLVPVAAFAARPRHGLVPVARRKAAAFLLPAPGARLQAQAFAGQVEVPGVPAALR